MSAGRGSPAPKAMDYAIAPNGSLARCRSGKSETVLMPPPAGLPVASSNTSASHVCKNPKLPPNGRPCSALDHSPAQRVEKNSLLAQNPLHHAAVTHNLQQAVKLPTRTWRWAGTVGPVTRKMATTPPDDERTGQCDGEIRLKYYVNLI